ncbi:DUF1631 domain-containing protein [Herbaspirillum frisingense]|uniref:hypothetical protein n=1 Tax=Herbaspirillum frisingense TaxID=92645 RepID=UPI0016033CBB|nr:hypothetical protein [Herbaspirillum frisingense]QNB08391.1 DUF1631 domain-containing protein [Herbaspirillum frisingense]
MTESIKILPVEPCGAVGKCMSHPSSYASSLSSYSKPTTARIASYALTQLETARAKDLATHEANEPAIAANLEVAKRVRVFMEQIGMPASYSERDTKSRSRYPKTIRHDAGYLQDLRRECKTDDGFTYATATYERLKKEYQDYADKAAREAEIEAGRAQREQEEALAKRKADMALAAILLRYELPLESTWSDVLDHLRTKDQRLDLAIAMRDTRGDWSEGAYRVKNALQRFTIHTNEDKDIAADVAAHLVEFEDGRVFRDCEWNYDRLLGTVVDRQLVADAEIARKNLED